MQAVTTALPLLKRGTLALACMLYITSCAREPTTRDVSVLFVGNSLTFYNDMPAMFRELAAAQHPGWLVHTEMLATGGISIEQHLTHGVLGRTLTSKKFDAVVLQDIGGWPLCPEGGLEGCDRSPAALASAAKLARDSGALPIWFSTWQGRPEAQRALSSEAERSAATLQIRVADVGAALLRYVPTGNEAALRNDGHPESLGSWVAAATILQTMTGESLATDITLSPACRTPWQGSGLKAEALASEQTAPATDCSIPSASQLGAIVKAVNAGFVLR